MPFVTDLCCVLMLDTLNWFLLDTKCRYLTRQSTTFASGSALIVRKTFGTWVHKIWLTDPSVAVQIHAQHYWPAIRAIMWLWNWPKPPTDLRKFSSINRSFVCRNRTDHPKPHPWNNKSCRNSSTHWNRISRNRWSQLVSSNVVVYNTSTPKSPRTRQKLSVKP